MFDSYITSTAQETQALAQKFASTLKGGNVLLLYGDLGYGKTTFMQGLAKGLGIERHLNSPTFIIMRSYKLEEREKTLYHVDLYRLHHEQEIIDLGLLDMMGKEDHIIAIEWPEKLGSLVPEHRTEIHFTYIDEMKRKIEIEQF